MFVEDTVIPVGDAKWALVAVICLLVIVFRHRRDISDVLYPPFDMPIGRAMEHLVAMPHTLQEGPEVERRALKDLHAEMKRGTVAVIGTPLKGGRTQRISKRMCRRLYLVMAVTPTGDQCCLLSKNSDKDSYVGLIVSSREIYRYWPRTNT